MAYLAFLLEDIFPRVFLFIFYFILFIDLLHTCQAYFLPSLLYERPG